MVLSDLSDFVSTEDDDYMTITEHALRHTPSTLKPDDPRGMTAEAKAPRILEGANSAMEDTTTDARVFRTPRAQIRRGIPSSTVSSTGSSIDRMV